MGLNAIAQWCGTLESPMYQGLGTGLLFTDNVDIPLRIEQDNLWFDSTDIDMEEVINWLDN